MQGWHEMVERVEKYCFGDKNNRGDILVQLCLEEDCQKHTTIFRDTDCIYGSRYDITANKYSVIKSTIY
jgi:hypothetical protein